MGLVSHPQQATGAFGFGFAAGLGFAAVALPRRRFASCNLGYALSAASGPNPKG